MADCLGFVRNQRGRIMPRMARFFVYSTKEAAAALKEAHIPYRVHGEYCISVNNDDYSTAVEAFFRNDVSFQPE